MPIRSRSIATIAITAIAATTAALLLAACQSSSPPPSAQAQSAQVPTANFLNEPTSPDAIVGSDPAAVRLQDIGGYILLYYREHQAMPPSLDELRKIPGGEDLNFISPSAGQPFTFFPSGLWIPGRGDKCIIACDPVRAPNGNRWCLFMMPPRGTSALSVDVVTIPEPMFLSYRPVGQ